MILRDLAHEMGFQASSCMRRRTRSTAAELFRPSAILLDINLPDFSGLGVLDQLKRDPRTRHIPVHVVSVADYRREALELGAVGYALKPAKRRGAGRGAAAPGGEALAERAPRAHRRG